MTRKKLPNLGIVLLALATSCDRWLTKPSFYNSVDVVVSRRNGDPVPDVDLVLYTGQRPMGYGITGFDGRFTFSRVPRGLYGVIATPPAGYDVVESLIAAPSSLIADDFRVDEDSVSPIRFTLLKKGPGAVVVRVLRSDGVPIPGASVMAYDPKESNGQATTDANGNVAFLSLDYGVHGIVVIRPFLYRDFLTPGDSLYAYRDNIVVDDGSRDSIVVRLQRCVGTVRAIVVDQNGVPVPGTTAVFYTSTQQLGIGVTGNDGRVEYAQAPCATQLGVHITPAARHVVQEGRGSRFMDGFTVSNGSVVNLTFRVIRTS